MPNTIFLDPPANFSFRHTVYSHGWSELLPFELNDETWELSYVFTDHSGGNPTYTTINESEGKLVISIFSESIATDFEEKIVSEVKHILRFDEDLNAFYALAEKHPELKWVSEMYAGRLVRSPTVFEDLIKTVCTTNCSWGLTKSMVMNLVEKLGSEAVNGKKSFPTAQSMAQQNEAFFRNEIRAGYRSPYFVELAESVASGKIEPESWLSSDLPTVELKKQMKSVKGVGDYAAENLLKLVGRYDGLALDSFLRSQFYKKHRSEKPCDDKEISAFYEKFDRWRGLAIWCDMTERWFKLDN